MTSGYECGFAQMEDVDGWMALALRVQDNFPGFDEESYRQLLKKNIVRRSAICAKREGKIVGVLLFSLRQGMLSCMAVDPAHRRRGIASGMIEMMLAAFAPDASITVSTFRDGDPLGDAPRALYRKFGFEPGELTIEFGYPNQVFVLKREVTPH